MVERWLCTPPVIDSGGVLSSGSVLESETESWMSIGSLGCRPSQLAPPRGWSRDRIYRRNWKPIRFRCSVASQPTLSLVITSDPANRGAHRRHYHNSSPDQNDHFNHLLLLHCTNFFFVGTLFRAFQTTQKKSRIFVQPLTHKLRGKKSQCWALSFH